MRDLADWAGRDVLDVGCGTGFHLPLFAADARAGHRCRAAPAAGRDRPSATSSAAATSRCSRAAPRRCRCPTARSTSRTRAGPTSSAPGASPGWPSSTGSMRPGGTAFVIDNDPTTSTFGGWFRRGFPNVDPVAVEAFWAEQGWSARAADDRLDLRRPRGLRVGRAHRAADGRGRGGPGRAPGRRPASTTRSTCGGAGTETAHGTDPPEAARVRCRQSRRVERRTTRVGSSIRPGPRASSGRAPW